MTSRKYLPDIENYFIDILDEGFEMSYRESKKWGATPDGEIDTIEILISRRGRVPRTNWTSPFDAPTRFTSENWGNIREKLMEFCDRILSELQFKKYYFVFRNWVIYGSTTFINTDNESIDTLPTIAGIENFIQRGQLPGTISLEFTIRNNNFSKLKYLGDDSEIGHHIKRFLELE